MNIIVPMDGNDIEESKITTLNDVQYWASFGMFEGKMINAKFYKSRDDIEEFVELLIVNNENEDIEDFVNEGIVVLLAPMQKYIEDIVEGYIFKELRDFEV